MRDTCRNAVEIPTERSDCRENVKCEMCRSVGDAWQESRTKNQYRAKHIR